MRNVYIAHDLDDKSEIDHLLTGIDTAALGYKCTEHAASEHATHVVLSK